MATVFGDDVDVGDVLEKHRERVAEVKALASPSQQIDKEGTYVNSDADNHHDL
jgi:hypothetical protein